MRAEEYINQIPMWTREKNSLEEIRQFLEGLGNPDQKLPIIHVAGSNGKGSVCAYLTSSLLQAGYRVGTFVSPHLVDIRERFLLDGQMISQEDFEACFAQVKEKADTWQAEGGKHPTFFEFLFYMAVVYFAEKKVDFFVMETGLGGRLDATNAVRVPLAVVITSISLEHTQYLGNTIGEIAGEKAGIIKEQVPVIFDQDEPEAASVIMARAKQMKSPCVPVSQKDYRLKRDSEGQVLVEMKDGGGEFKLPFPAAYQGKNGALALRTLEVLMAQGKVSRDKNKQLLEGLGKTRWPGRMEEVLPGVFLDGAHNPGGIEAFGRAAREIRNRRQGETSSLRGRKKVLLLFSAVEDKDVRGMVRRLGEWIQPDLVAAAKLHSERGLSVGELEEMLSEEISCPVKGFETVEEAFLTLCSQKGREDILFCTGSLYLVGEIKKVEHARKLPCAHLCG